MTLPVNASPPQRRVNSPRLQEGRAEMNARLHDAVTVSTPTSREVQALDAKLQNLDQGSRGAAHEPEAPQDANSWMRQALREGREGNG